MTNRENIKFKMLASNPADIYVVTHATKEGGIEYVVFNDFKVFTAISMYENWMEATWFDSREEAESQIADGARNVYSVEHIRISRENLERGVKVTKEPPKAKFKCTCGCEFETDLDACRQTRSDLEGEYRVYQSISFWSKCPACGEECADTRIK